jgi:tetratricopeptide (TPR) repeat protein
MSNAMSQVEIIETKRGNDAMANGDTQEAIEYYKKALEANPSYKEAAFNLGNAYQAQSMALSKEAAQLEDEAARQQYVEQIQNASKQAAAQFELAQKQAETDNEINDTQYNLGNANLVGGELDKSIAAYKEALRKNPADEEARYNLAYAQRMKKQQEQQQQQDQQNQDQQQDQKQDQEKQEQEQNQDQQKQDQQQEQEQQQQQQQQQEKQMSKEEAEQLLEALQKQEKDLQDKLKKKTPVKRVKIEKDW